MRLLKRSGICLIALVMLLSPLLPGVSGGFLAQAVGNNTSKTATPVSVNTAVSESLASSSDVDYYKFSIQQDGVVAVDFQHAVIDSPDVCWKFFLYTDTMSELFVTSSTGKQASVTGPQVGLPAGTYYLKVAANRFSAEPYRFLCEFQRVRRVGKGDQQSVENRG